MNYYERYCGDYARDTGHLSLQEHGAYTVMLDTYYATETALPADYKALYRICRAMGAKEQESVRAVADQFFPIGADGLRHNRKADELIADARPRIDAARVNGRKGGRPRKETQQVFTENPAGLEQEPTGKAHQHQHQHQEERSKALSGTPDASPREEARKILEFLNTKTGRQYEPVNANLELIVARLREGYSSDDIRSVVAKKCREWSGDEKMAPYLRPATLFNRTKFAQYQGELQKVPNG
jgi:uncharacterized phage protein (TIGR02220 family)